MKSFEFRIVLLIISELSDQLCKLQLATASLARKQHNFNLAERLLLDQAGTLLHGISENDSDIDTLQIALKQLYSVSSLKKLDILRIERESAKLLHSVGEPLESVDILSKSVVNYTCSDKVRTALCSELCSRSLLTLVKWLQVDHKLLSSLALKVGQGDGKNSVSQNIEQLLELEEKTAECNHTLIINGAISGKLFHFFIIFLYTWG
jgi:PI-3-kinase-related kinase SMG-1